MLIVTAKLPQFKVRSTCGLSRSSVPLTARKGPYTEEKSVKSPGLLSKSLSSHLKYHLYPTAWVIPGELNAMKTLVHCNCGLATMSGEVDVRFIALLSPFDRTQRHFLLRKSQSSHLKYHLDPAAWVHPGVS